MRNYKAITLSFFAIASLLFLNSCSEEKTHPITWHHWIDNAKTKLLCFYQDGRFRDLYDYSHTYKHQYEIGEKLIKFKNITLDKDDTSSAEVLYLQDGKLVIKYKDKRVDSLSAAKSSDLMVGNWAPFGVNEEEHYFTMGKESYDCIWSPQKKEKRYFRYKIIDDKTAEFDYYLEHRKEKVKYEVSKDGLALMLSGRDFTVTLKRI